MSIFKDCDIRGIYDSEINEESVYRIGRGLAAMLPPGGEIRVGGDVRLSTPSLKESLIAGLVRGGARVADLGVIPTPVDSAAKAAVGNSDKTVSRVRKRDTICFFIKALSARDKKAAHSKGRCGSPCHGHIKISSEIGHKKSRLMWRRQSLAHA